MHICLLLSAFTETTPTFGKEKKESSKTKTGGQGIKFKLTYACQRSHFLCTNKKDSWANFFVSMQLRFLFSCSRPVHAAMTALLTKKNDSLSRQLYGICPAPRSVIASSARTMRAQSSTVIKLRGRTKLVQPSSLS